jgi:hypothetical protein
MLSLICLLPHFMEFRRETAHLHREEGTSLQVSHIAPFLGSPLVNRGFWRMSPLKPLTPALS